MARHPARAVMDARPYRGQVGPAQGRRFDAAVHSADVSVREENAHLRRRRRARGHHSRSIPTELVEPWLVAFPPMSASSRFERSS